MAFMGAAPGEYSWADKSVYYGYYKNDKLNGEGVYVDANNVTKGGIFKDGNFSSTFPLDQNNKSTGCLSGDCTNGFGKYVYSNQDIYLGFFKNGNLSNGAYVYANNDIYIGEFVNSKKVGFGIFTWANQNNYAGMFLNDTYDGLGYYYDKEDINKDQIGEFRNGSLYRDMSPK